MSDFSKAVQAREVERVEFSVQKVMDQHNRVIAKLVSMAPGDLRKDARLLIQTLISQGVIEGLAIGSDTQDCIHREAIRRTFEE